MSEICHLSSSNIAYSLKIIRNSQENVSCMIWLIPNHLACMNFLHLILCLIFLSDKKTISWIYSILGLKNGPENWKCPILDRPQSKDMAESLEKQWFKQVFIWSFSELWRLYFWLKSQTLWGWFPMLSSTGQLLGSCLS